MNNNKYNITQYDFQEYSETLEKTVQLVKSKTVLGSSLLKSESNINIQQRSTTSINCTYTLTNSYCYHHHAPSTWGLSGLCSSGLHEDFAKQPNKINGIWHLFMMWVWGLCSHTENKNPWGWPSGEGIVTAGFCFLFGVLTHSLSVCFET